MENCGGNLSVLMRRRSAQRPYSLVRATCSSPNSVKPEVVGRKYWLSREATSEFPEKPHPRDATSETQGKHPTICQVEVDP